MKESAPPVSLCFDVLFQSPTYSHNRRSHDFLSLFIESDDHPLDDIETSGSLRFT